MHMAALPPATKMLAAHLLLENTTQDNTLILPKKGLKKAAVHATPANLVTPIPNASGPALPEVLHSLPWLPAPVPPPSITTAMVVAPISQVHVGLRHPPHPTAPWSCATIPSTSLRPCLCTRTWRKAGGSHLWLLQVLAAKLMLSHCSFIQLPAQTRSHPHAWAGCLL